MIKRFDFRFRWTHGGLFLGMRLTFPVRVMFDDLPSKTRDVTTLSIGFFVAQLDIEYRSKAKPWLVPVFYEH